MTGLSASEAERFNTFAVEIAALKVPEGTARIDAGDWTKFAGIVQVNRRNGRWYSRRGGKAGHSALGLVRFLTGCSEAEAAQFAAAWLASHAGVGSCTAAGDDEEDATPASRADAEEVLARIEDILDMPGEALLTSRKLPRPYPSIIKFLRNARCGEHAIVGILTARGRVVGVQLIYVDPLGRASTVRPTRRTFKIERSPDAVFDVPAPGESSEVCISEGIPNLLTMQHYGAPRCRNIGLPGIAALRHLRFAKGIKAIVIRDGDNPQSAAAKDLQRGLDRLILDGTAVYVTATPEGQDANSILQNAGVEELRKLLEDALPAVLSLDGEIVRLARLSPLDYARVRLAEAKNLGIRVGVLDEEVRKQRAATASSPPEDDWADIGDSNLWPDPVNGADLLSDLEKTIGAFVIMTKEQRWTVALWIVFTHCFEAALNAAKLWIKSAEPRSGKTRLIELLKHLVREALTAEGMTASVMVRLIARLRPTLLLDEADNWIKEDADLRKVINSGFDPDGHVWINVPIKDDWEPKAFSTWAPQAIAGLGNLHPTNADRSFKIELERKPRTQKVARLRRTDIGPLIDLRLKAARWAADNIDDLRDATPKMPEALNDRAADAWAICIAIADCAGGAWGEQARTAALIISGDGALDSETIGVQLLSDIRDVFEQLPEKNHKKQAITSQGIVVKLTELEDQPWPDFRRGQPLSQPQLARLLRPFHISPYTLRVGKVNAKGYRRTQFEAAFERYLPPLPEEPFTGDYTYTHPPPPNSLVTPSQDQDPRGFEPDFKPSQEGKMLRSENPKNPSVSPSCDGVTAKKGGPGRKHIQTPLPNGGTSLRNVDREEPMQKIFAHMRRLTRT
jgi:putative DNA primase/helicase